MCTLNINVIINQNNKVGNIVMMFLEGQGQKFSTKGKGRFCRSFWDICVYYVVILMNIFLCTFYCIFKIERFGESKN